MWHNYSDNPIYTYGQHGKQFTLSLRFKIQYYGRINEYKQIVVNAIWDSVNEAFYEKDTGLEIYKYDIFEWWEDIEDDGE